MHRRSCILVCRTVPVVPPKTLTTSSLALHCPRATAARHYFAGVALVIQLFLISSFLFVSYGEPLWLVSLSFCAPAPFLGVCVCGWVGGGVCLYVCVCVCVRVCECVPLLSLLQLVSSLLFTA